MRYHWSMACRYDIRMCMCAQVLPYVCMSTQVQPYNDETLLEHMMLSLYVLVNMHIYVHKCSPMCETSKEVPLEHGMPV
jgi:hypothetical protein